jgi:tetratricopeptide (TPR) repeat protein
VGVRCNALLPREQRPNVFVHNDKVHRLTGVTLIAGVLLSLAVLSLPTFAQAPPITAKTNSQIDLRISSSGDSRNQSASPDVISVSHLRIPVKAARHLEAAQKWFAEMQLAQAAKEIDRAIKVYPAFAQAFCRKALVQLAGKDFTGSVESAAHAISLDDTDAYSWIALATAFNSLNEWPEAEAAASRSLLLDSFAWQGRLEMAKSFYGEGKYVPALNILDQLRQDIPDIHLVRANSLMRIGRTQEAVQQFSIFLGETPGDSRADRIRQILARVRAIQN